MLPLTILVISCILVVALNFFITNSHFKVVWVFNWDINRSRNKRLINCHYAIKELLLAMAEFVYCKLLP